MDMIWVILVGYSGGFNDDKPVGSFQDESLE